MHFADLIGCLESREHSNGSMVRHLRATGALKTDHVTAAMLAVDRGDYLSHPEAQLNYQDMPIKVGAVHLSAPSIYASALEALDVRPGCSFLNIGSGTGYLSTIVARLAGPHTVNHGVEHQAELVALARRLAAARSDAPHLLFFEANAMQLQVEPPASASAASAACCMKYDRIYVAAAALPEQRVLCSLLRKGGILVGPFEAVESDGQLLGQQNLLKIVRTGANSFAETRLQPVQFAPLRQPARAELARMPPLALRPLIWAPEEHARFPPSFRAAVRLLLWLWAQRECPLSLLPRELLLRTISLLPFYAFEPRRAVKAPCAEAAGGSKTPAPTFSWLHTRTNTDGSDGGDGGADGDGGTGGGRTRTASDEGSASGSHVPSDSQPASDMSDMSDGEESEEQEEEEGGAHELGGEGEEHGAALAAAMSDAADDLAAAAGMASRSTTDVSATPLPPDAQSVCLPSSQCRCPPARAQPMLRASRAVLHRAQQEEDGGADLSMPGETPPSAPQQAPQARPLWFALGQSLSRRALHFQL